VNVTSKPVNIQVAAKTWAPGVDVTATFADFNIEATKLTGAGQITGKVTTNGPDPSKGSVQIAEADGTVDAVVPIDAGGNFSAAATPGTKVVSIVGDKVVANQPAATQNVTVVGGQTVTANFNVQYYADLDPTKDQIFEDKFPGTTLNPMWTVETPKAGPTVSVNNGLNITNPAGSIFDYWVGVTDSPRITLPAPPGDFILTGKLNSANDDAGNPQEGQDYHSALYLSFGGDDAFFWGAYRSNSTLQLERTGTGGIGTVTTDGLPVWVQVRKTSNGQTSSYAFYYKQNDSDDWTQVTDVNGDPLIQTVSKSPVKVGIVQKSWASMPFISATWSDFQLEAATLASTPPAVKPGDLNGDGTVNVQDATLSLRIAVGLLTPSDAQKTAGDVNNDGKWNVQDATLILRIAVGLATP
jgi:hypothetical protein